MAVKKRKAAVDSSQKKEKVVTAAIQPSIERVRLLAYYNYLAREEKHLPGNELSDWVNAERSLG